MGILRNLRYRLRGREFWRQLNRSLFIGIYSLLIISVLVFPQYILWILLGVVIFLPSYIAFFINHLREMEKKKKGNKVLGGWIEHEHGLGEPFYLYADQILPVDRLSKTDLAAVDAYVDMIMRRTEEQIMIEVGEKSSETPRHLLTYEQFKEIEKEEKERIDKEWEIWKEHRDKQRNEIIGMNNIEEESEKTIQTKEEDIISIDIEKEIQQYEEETGEKAVYHNRPTIKFGSWLEKKINPKMDKLKIKNKVIKNNKDGDTDGKK